MDSRNASDGFRRSFTTVDRPSPGGSVPHLKYPGSGRSGPARGLRQVEAVQIHHLVPRVHEVAHEGLLPVVATVDFRDGAEFGV